MSTLKWHQGRHLAFDAETTSADPNEARIVTAAAVHMIPGQRPIAITWVIDPGVDIPAEAAEVHGWTNDRIAETIGRPGWAIRTINRVARPMPRAAALFEITRQLRSAMDLDAAVVVHNAAYDLTLLEHEDARHDVTPLSARDGGIVGVVDPMVIEKAFDPYRKACYKKAPDGTPCDQENREHVCGGCRGGKWRCGGCGVTDRTLSSLCRHYGVVHAGAHDCADDAVACARLLHKLVAGWPDMARWRLATLHENQARWRHEQMDGLRAFFDRVGKDHDGMCPAWPVHTDACASAHRAPQERAA